jgi:transcriptional regulator with XRE-family HTH domain
VVTRQASILQSRVRSSPGASSPSERVDLLSVVKTGEQRQARELRALGWSVKEIERHLGVARSSVSRWVRDVELDAEAKARLATRVSRGPLVAAVRKAVAARRVRASYQEQGRRLARERDASYALGCMLHWAEGDNLSSP